jgi:hypothetical protein
LLSFQVIGDIKEVLGNDFESEEECDSDEDSFSSDASSDKNVTSADTNISMSFSSLKMAGTLNLDITAMIAFVSVLTNGCSNFVFKEPILSQQAEWERLRPVKVFLENIFRGQKKKVFQIEKGV